jgi:hypothetical protein
MASSRPPQPPKLPQEENDTPREDAMQPSASNEAASSDIEIHNLNEDELDGDSTEHDEDDAVADYPDEEDTEEGMQGEGENEEQEDGEEDADDDAAAARYANEVLRLLMGRLQRPAPPPVLMGF